MIGRAWGDRERLRATSPALQAERIRAPVLLVHGSADRVVPVAQSDGMAKALKRAGMRLFLFRNQQALRVWLACFLRCEDEIEALSQSSRGAAFEVRLRGRVIPLKWSPRTRR